MSVLERSHAARAPTRLWVLARCGPVYGRDGEPSAGTLAARQAAFVPEARVGAIAMQRLLWDGYPLRDPAVILEG